MHGFRGLGGQGFDMARAAAQSSFVAKTGNRIEH
jgi:hypothetical protein